jgi:hypothetical protein
VFCKKYDLLARFCKVLAVITQESNKNEINKVRQVNWNTTSSVNELDQFTSIMPCCNNTIISAVQLVDMTLLFIDKSNRYGFQTKYDFA